MPYDANGNLVDDYGNPIQADSGGYGFQPLQGGVEVGPVAEGLGGAGGPGDQSQYVGVAPVTTAPAAPGPTTLEQILAQARANKKENIGIIDDWSAQYLPKLESAQAEADAGQKSALDDLTGLYDGAQEIGYHDPTASLDSAAAKAAADPQARAAQYDALRQLKGFTNPGVSPVERFLQEQARTAEERDQRAHRDAALRSMAARGVRSGGAEMTALLGGQQMTSNNRLTSDLGTQAGAMMRAVNATGQYGNMASTIAQQTGNEAFNRGQASDVMSRFNTETSAQYQRDKTAHQVAERDSKLQRGSDKFGAQSTYFGQKFGRQALVNDASWTPTAAKVGANSQGNGGLIDALKLQLGSEEAEKARKELANKEGDIPWYQMVFDPGAHTGNWGSSDSGSAGQQKIKKAFF